MPGAFKLDHLQPIEPILFTYFVPIFYQLSSVVLGFSPEVDRIDEVILRHLGRTTLALP